MRVALFFTVIFAVCSIALSAIARYPAPKPGKHGYCWSEETGPMEKNEVRTPKGQCLKMECNNDRTMVAQSCGVSVDSQGNRYILEDLSKPYPECCPGPR